MRKSLVVVLVAMAGSVVAAPIGTAGTAHEGEFFYLCEFSHRSQNDPILYPGKAGASPRNDFYGNMTTNADSTAQSLVAGKTTCRVLDDKSAYWFATLMRKGKVQKPWKVHIYYRNQVAAHPRPFPLGLEYLAGDPNATRKQRDWEQRYFWQCGDTVASTHFAKPPDCPDDGNPEPGSSTGDTLTLMIRFPQCWDGTRKDSKNHHAHIVYPVNDACPKDHPVLVPQLQVHVQWAINNGASGPKLSLSSGSIFGIHAEFFDAWKKARLRSLIKSCIDAGVSCHPNDLSP
ncbi:MAG: DUF1996 domain-containing protein [Actinobacteria bacterium]|nr:MAG: DUF1996 domain-containing protein [Actinomycetota bacterium]